MPGTNRVITLQADDAKGALATMQETQIPALIEALVKLGFRVAAVGDSHFVIDDSVLPQWNRLGAKREFARLKAQFGNYDHLRLEIVSYLKASGRIADSV